MASRAFLLAKGGVRLLSTSQRFKPRMATPTTTLTPLKRAAFPMQSARRLSIAATRNPPEYDHLFADREDDYGFQRRLHSLTFHELKTYAAMRQRGEKISDDIANKVRAIIIEDASALTGVAVVAAYDDGTACFYNGKKLYASSSDEDEFLSKIINNLFEFTMKEVSSNTTPIKDDDRGGHVPLGMVRVSLLTAGGLRRIEYKSYSEVFDVVTCGTDLGLYLVLNGN